MFATFSVFPNMSKRHTQLAREHNGMHVLTLVPEFSAIWHLILFFPFFCNFFKKSKCQMALYSDMPSTVASKLHKLSMIPYVIISSHK